MSDLILIGGETCSGKTTIAAKLSEWLGSESVVCSLDDYYRDGGDIPGEQTMETRFDHPDEIDWQRALSDVRLMLEKQSVETPVYNFRMHRRADHTVHKPAGEIVVLEGLFALYEQTLVERAVARIFVDCDEPLRVNRRIRRDASERGRKEYDTLMQYLMTSEPPHREIAELTRANAELIVSGSGDPDTALLTVKDFLLGMTHCADVLLESGYQAPSSISDM